MYGIVKVLDDYTKNFSKSLANTIEITPNRPHCAVAPNGVL